MNKDSIKILKFFYEDKTKFKSPLFTLRGISKCYGSNELFSDVNLTVNFNDRITIVGSNGVGKSTLLKIIAGQEEEDDGNMDRNKDLRIGYLPQETHWKSLENTILQEIRSANFKGADCHRCEGLVERLLENFGLSEKNWQRKVKTLSGGERTKLALAKILGTKPNLLILDEPTNHLDLETIEWLEQFLSNWKLAIISVSHDRCFLDRTCNKTFELTEKGLEKYYCSYSQYLEEKAGRLEKKEREYKQQEKYFKKQQVFIDRFRYKATKARAVQNRIKQLDRIERVEKISMTKNIKIGFNAKEKTCAHPLEINNLTIGKKESPLFRIADKITVDWGDKIGIIGQNGIGKSTLLKNILDKRESAEINFGPGIKIGYYAQAHEELDPDKSILEECSSKTTASEERIRNVLGRLLFVQDKVFKKIDCLSGGERARVALAEIILQEPNFLLLDEPTNHLDLPSKEVVVEMLKEFTGTILLVSHDRYILNKVCDTIWEIKDEKLKQHIGNYEDYRHSVNTQ